MWVKILSPLLLAEVNEKLSAPVRVTNAFLNCPSCLKEKRVPLSRCRTAAVLSPFRQIFPVLDFRLE